MTSKLHQIVKERLTPVDPDDYRRIADETGLTVSWIRAFAADRIPNPSASRLETLYQGIAGAPIKIEG